MQINHKLEIIIYGVDIIEGRRFPDDWGGRKIQVEKGIDSTRRVQVSNDAKLQRSRRRIHESKALTVGESY